MNISAPGDHKSNFLKVGLIPCGFNTMGTQDVNEKKFMCIKSVEKVFVYLTMRDYLIIEQYTHQSRSGSKIKLGK